MFRMFQHFPDDALMRLADLAREVTVDADHVVHHEGDQGEDFWVVVAGSIEGSRATPMGKQPVIRVRAGQMLGDVSFLDGKARPVTAVATQPTVMLRFDAAKVRALLERDHELSVYLLRTFWHSMASKTRQTNQFMAEVFTRRDTIQRSGSPGAGQDVNMAPGTKLELFKEKGMSAAELRLLAMTLPAHRYPPETYIFMEGDPGTCLYIVIEGRVRVSRRIPDMGEETLAVLDRGEVFGEMALVDDQPRSADVRSHTEGSTVLSVSQTDLEEILNLPPLAAAQFLRLLDCILCRRLRNMVDLLVSWRMMAGFGESQPPR
jgi:CRP/FNR family transcriptional regulator, cyclic AMP receptor protein